MPTSSEHPHARPIRGAVSALGTLGTQPLRARGRRGAPVPCASSWPARRAVLARCARRRKLYLVSSGVPVPHGGGGALQRTLRPRLAARAAQVALRVAGWRLVGTAPAIAKCVLIFAPHTSNWNFPLLLAVRSA